MAENSNIAPYENPAYPTLTTAAQALDAIIEDGFALDSGAAQDAADAAQETADDHIADTTAAHAGSAISYDPTDDAGVLDGVEDVQSALAALAAAIDAL